MEIQRESVVQKEIISEGGAEWPLEPFFLGALSKFDKQAISFFTLNWCLKAKIIDYCFHR